MYSSLLGSRFILRRTYKFTRKLLKSSVGRDVYAFSEMADHAALLSEHYSPCADISPGMAGMEDCESSFAH